MYSPFIHSFVLFHFYDGYSLVDVRAEDPLDTVAVELPILTVLLRALVLIASPAMDIQRDEIDRVQISKDMVVSTG
jgi:hypothetical protein